MFPPSLPVSHLEKLCGPLWVDDFDLAIENDWPWIQFLSVLHHNSPTLLNHSKHHHRAQLAANRLCHVGKRLQKSNNNASLYSYIKKILWYSFIETTRVATLSKVKWNCWNCRHLTLKCWMNSSSVSMSSSVRSFGSFWRHSWTASRIDWK